MYILKAPEEVLPSLFSVPCLVTMAAVARGSQVAKIWVWEAASTAETENSGGKED